MNYNQKNDNYNGKSISSVIDNCWDKIYQDAIAPIESYRKKARRNLYIYRTAVALLLSAALFVIVPVGFFVLLISIGLLHLNMIARYIEKVICLYSAILKADFIKKNTFEKIRNDFESDAADRIYTEIGVKKDEDAYRCYFENGLEATCKEFNTNKLTIGVPFVRDFQSVTVVSKEKISQKELKSFNKSESTDLKEIQMDNPDFNKKYHVFSQDSTDAHFILSQDFMERLLGACVSTLYFSDNTMFIYCTGTFSWFYLKSMENVFDEDLLSKERIIECLHVFAKIDSLIHQLQLNESIWK